MAARRTAASLTNTLSNYSAPPLFDPPHQAGIESLLTQLYSKPVSLNLVKLSSPHHDADILAQQVVHQIRDRRTQPRRVVRNAAWNAKMPSQIEITRERQELLQRQAVAKPLSLSSLTFGEAVTDTTGERAGMMPVSDILKDLALPQVTAVQVETKGRLGRRITADMSAKKIARKGLTGKGAAYVVRDTIKANKTQGLRSGKRKVGVYGVRVDLVHS